MDGETHSGEAEQEMTRLWRTFKTVYELLADRVGTARFPCLDNANHRRATKYLRTSWPSISMNSAQNIPTLWAILSMRKPCAYPHTYNPERMIKHQIEKRKLTNLSITAVPR